MCPLNTGDCLIEMTAWADLPVYISAIVQYCVGLYLYHACYVNIEVSKIVRSLLWECISFGGYMWLLLNNNIQVLCRPYCDCVTIIYVYIIWNRRGHECSRIWKLSTDFTLIQCIKIMSIFLGRDMSGTNFLRSKLVSFNQTLVPYEISKVNFRCA